MNKRIATTALLLGTVVAGAFLAGAHGSPPAREVPAGSVSVEILAQTQPASEITEIVSVVRATPAH